MSLSRTEIENAKTDPMIYFRPYIVEVIRESIHLRRGAMIRRRTELILERLYCKRLTSSCESLQRFSRRNAVLCASTSSSVTVMIEDAQAVIRTFEDTIRGGQNNLNEELARQSLEETKRSILQADSVRRYDSVYGQIYGDERRLTRG